MKLVVGHTHSSLLHPADCCVNARFRHPDSGMRIESSATGPHQKYVRLDPIYEFPPSLADRQAHFHNLEAEPDVPES